MRRLDPVALVALPSALVPAAAAAAPKPGTLVTHKVHSIAPHHREVREYLVRVYDPLPPDAGAHPAACDWIQYLRFRNADGPREAKDADAVVVIIPGFLGGAGSFDQVARNTVRSAAERGRSIEYWSLDRRANCLEDHRGVRAAARAGDPSVAYDYYWGGRPVNGKTFGGFVSPQDAAFLGELRARADDAGLVRGPAHRDPGPAPPRPQGDLRRALARRAADGRVRELGLRRRPEHHARRRLQAVRRAWSASTPRSRFTAAPAARRSAGWRGWRPARPLPT